MTCASLLVQTALQPGRRERTRELRQARRKPGVGRCEVDPRAGAALHDDSRRRPVRLDPDRAGGDALCSEAVAQQGQVIEAVEERDDEPGLDADPLERLAQSDRFGRDEQDVRRFAEAFGGGRVGANGWVDATRIQGTCFKGVTGRSWSRTRRICGS